MKLTRLEYATPVPDGRLCMLTPNMTWQESLEHLQNCRKRHPWLFLWREGVDAN